jgi:hypothetical protein
LQEALKVYPGSKLLQKANTEKVKN